MTLDDLQKPSRKIKKAYRDIFKIEYDRYFRIFHKYPLCPVCGREIIHGYDIGHRIARFCGGSTEADNLVLVHSGAPCNVGVAPIIINEEDAHQYIRIKVSE
jgi:5-methylcytosine-specific restriction endonuclease McrA